MPSRSVLWRVADSLMLVAFLLSIAVQINDPDPLPWMLIYGLAAAACAASLRDTKATVFPASIGAAAFVWAIALAPRVLGRVPFADMFGAFEMKSVDVELSREMYGLLIIAAWMTVIAVRTHARRSTP